ncbi:MAG: PilX N-terminal domain-containing pilus assembly protein [Thiobacillaceae bacterium]|nr:PilX N-terminal domain-containing pilus assembly protein [Thiobacillaceae bacterium]
MKTDRMGFHGRQRQHGAALVMGLLMLSLLSLLGLSAMGTGALEARMAANSRDRLRAFEAAEAALRACEARLPALRHVDVIPVQDDELGVTLPLLPTPSCTVERAQTITGRDRSLEAQAHEVDSYRIYRLRVEAQGVNPNTRVRLQAHVRQRV